MRTRLERFKKFVLDNKLLLLWCLFGSSVLFTFQNCSESVKFASVATQQSSTSIPLNTYTQQITVLAEKPNPPLDLFFIVDNSASMAGHQINLGANFSSIFTNNIANLSKFDTNIYVFSTNSTVHPSYLSTIPTLSPAAVTTLPAVAVDSSTPVNDVASLTSLPGGIFGIWNSAQGTPNQIGYNAQFYPAPTLGTNVGTGPSSGTILKLSMPKIGSLSPTDYAAQAAGVTKAFQQTLAFLNPNNYLTSASAKNYEASTAVSSGLCTMARILKHANDQGYISKGDAAAFVIVSDDNDRLNDRNINNNQCVETFSDQANVVNGLCGHHQVSFSYNSTNTLTYNSTSTFSYQSKAGTTLPYSYLNGKEDCTIKYNTNPTYKYTYTYTQLQTAVTYNQCSQIADGTCISPKSVTINVPGNYSNGSASCTLSDMSKVSGVTSPAPGTTYSCQPANTTGLIAGGTDSASDGTACSSTVLNSINANTNIVVTTPCAIVSGSANSSSTTTTIKGLVTGSCSTFCVNNLAKFPGCILTNTTAEKAIGTLSFSSDNVTCNSTCPVAATCGSGTVAQYLTATFGSSAVCGTPYGTISKISVIGVTPTGTALSCNSSIAGIMIKNSSGAAVCQTLSNVGSTATVNDCILSLQDNPAAPSTCVANSGVGTTTIAAPVGTTCNTPCSSTGSFCASTNYNSVANFIAATDNGYCLKSTPGGAKSLTLSFQETVGNTASCSTPCNQTLTGSCDGNGWGAADGSTIADYISYLSPGASCAVQTGWSLVTDPKTQAIAVPVANSANYCANNPTNPFFSPVGSPYLTTSTTYTAGDSNHLASDFQSYIFNQATTIFSANNLPAVAVIGHLANDSLPGSDPSTDYIALTGPNYFNSNQVTDINGDYASALSNISSFIQTATQNNYILSLPSDAKMVSVSAKGPNDATWTSLDSSQWSLSGTTLSIAPSANLQIGYQIQYQYTSAQ